MGPPNLTIETDEFFDIHELKLKNDSSLQFNKLCPKISEYWDSGVKI
jgi:hypothetical protein